MNEYLCAAIKRKIPVNVGSKNYKISTLEDDDIYFRLKFVEDIMT